MNPIPSLYSSIERRSLVYSIMFHLILAASFIITFKPQDVANKPILVFWGSILESQDILSLSSSISQGQDKKGELPLTVSSDASRYNQTGSRSVVKPAYSPQIDKRRKEVPKSSFINEREAEPQKPSLEDLGIPLKPPERVPLKIYQAK